MTDSEKPTTKDVREFKIKELEKRLSTNHFYLNVAFQANGFFYLTTGAVLGYYLDKQPNDYLIFFLLLPILLGTVLGGIFIYGASLQKDTAKTIQRLQKDLRRNELVVETIPDLNLLERLLHIFGYILFVVVASLIAVPFFIERSTASQLKIVFLIVAGIILILGMGWSHIVACKRYKRMKRRVRSAVENQRIRRQQMRGPND